MSAPDELLAIRAAELYYQERKTQDEVGAILGLTRWKVGRLITQARDAGIVRIEIVHPRARRLQLERELREASAARGGRGLHDVIVVSSAGVKHRDELADRVAGAAADYLAALRPVPRSLGISWGRTLQRIAEALRPGWSSGTDVVQINGGVSLNQRAGMAAATAATIAQKGRGATTLLPSPAILERVETKRAIEADRVVAEMLDQARRADVHLFSAGAVDADSVHVASGYLTPAEIAQLLAKGAVGDVLGRYIDADGHIVDPGVDARTMGLTLDELRGVPRGIAVLSGVDKHAVASAIVASGLASVLITDEETARHVLDH